MKSLARYGNYPRALPLLADDIIEFHAVRLLFLLRYCGQANTIRGLTKMAKLDFFVRYPRFFALACEHLGLATLPTYSGVESHMIRFHYGPWDQRYYHVLSYLEGKRLITLSQEGNTYVISLTHLGHEVTDTLSRDDTFNVLREQISRVGEVLGNKRGNQLKEMVYQLFDKEVASLPLDTVIEG